ncbi:MAG: alpha/beta hydrolase [Actinomycetota bacterium]|nr:alpha/beta hydrolase [Actinomycetota bacterium]
MADRVLYDEFAYFADNASEHGLSYDGPPVVRREAVELGDGRHISALVWGDGAPEMVLVHGGAQNAHTWDTVALALARPLVAVDLPGHGHSDEAAEAGRDERIAALAADVAEAIRALAPDAAAIVGMSLGGMTSIAVATMAPELVRRLVLVDITPGVTGAKAKAIMDFVRGPATFASFEDLLARTIEHNPTRTESSLRRGILHNAVQQADGSWIWRYRRHDGVGPMDDAAADEPDETEQAVQRERAWGALGAVTVPVMLVRGMRPQSVVDDADETELRRRLPGARVEHVDAGHSVQGDQPVELARLLADFLAD